MQQQDDAERAEFCRLFPGLAPCQATLPVLEELAWGLVAKRNTLHQNQTAAGYVYFGQFLAHDLSHFAGSEETSHGERRPLGEFDQLSTPFLDLGGLYGCGLRDKRLLVDYHSGKFILGFTQPGQLDLPRDSDKSARIADKRNDQNLLLSQLHMRLMLAHNRLVDEVAGPSSGPEKFEQARQELTLRYHEAIIFDFLPQVLHPDTWSYYFKQIADGVWQRPAEQAVQMPVEFSGAAMRFGHAMVLPVYDINQNHQSLPIQQLFKLTGKGGLAGHEVLPADLVVDFRRFFDFGDTFVNLARTIKPKAFLRMSPDPSSVKTSLAYKNLARGRELGLPSAQSIIKLLQRIAVAPEVMPQLLTEEQLNPLISTARGRVLNHSVMQIIGDDTPLWYYLLAEAHADYLQQQPPQISRMGKLGSLILAECFRTLLQATPQGVFCSRQRRLSNHNSKLISRSGQLVGEANPLLWEQSDGHQFTKITDILQYAGV